MEVAGDPSVLTPELSDHPLVRAMGMPGELNAVSWNILTKMKHSATRTNNAYKMNEDGDAYAARLRRVAARLLQEPWDILCLQEAPPEPEWTDVLFPALEAGVSAAGGGSLKWVSRKTEPNSFHVAFVYRSDRLVAWEVGSLYSHLLPEKQRPRFLALVLSRLDRYGFFAAVGAGSLYAAPSHCSGRRVRRNRPAQLGMYHRVDNALMNHYRK
jgi:hypothetical protein